MRKFIAIASAVTLTLGLPALAAAQAASSQAKPDPPKAETKAPPSVAGKWTLNVDGGGGAMDLPMELKVDGKKLTGTIVGPQGEPANLAGEYADGKLTFTLTTPDGGMTITFKATLKEDGTIAGSLDMQGNEVPWTATRVKG
jgi:hypothetical protein